ITSPSPESIRRSSSACGRSKEPLNLSSIKGPIRSCTLCKAMFKTMQTGDGSDNYCRSMDGACGLAHGVRQLGRIDRLEEHIGGPKLARSTEPRAHGRNRDDRRPGRGPFPEPLD